MNPLLYREIHVIVNREKNRLEFPLVPGLPEPTFAKMYRELVRNVLCDCQPGRFEPYERALPIAKIPDDLEKNIQEKSTELAEQGIPLDPNI